MAKEVKTSAKAVANKKRKQEDVQIEEDSSSDEEINVSGLLDDEASDDDEEESSEADSEDSDGEYTAKASKEGDELEDDESDDEDSKFNELLGEEDDISDVNSEEFEEEPFDDTRSITDRLTNIKIRSFSSNSESDNFIETKFSDGRPRTIRPEIEPVYDSDDSDHDNFNTIGNIPLSAYEEMPHIGYDINGKRIMRPARGSALDQLLESIELPEGWTGLLDQNTGASLNLTKEELELIDKIQKNQMTDESINPYEPTIEWFTSKVEISPVTATPEPKRRFVPSKHEAKRIMKIVRAIRDGRIVPSDKLKEQEEDEKYNYDLWADNNNDTEDHVMTLRAPKLPPPTNEESYNPPEEYLLTEEEKKKWEETEPSDRERNFIPQKFDALRKVPGYQDSLRERFERSLDLYLAPRVRHNKLNIDPESLIPELPSPKDLRPFPIRCSTIYSGHKGRVRTLSIDPSGLWLATGGDDGSVRIWEILTGRQVYMSQIVNKETDDSDNIEAIEWSPDQQTGILAIAAGENIYLIVPPIFGFDIENISKLKIESGFGHDTFGNKKKGDLNVNEDEEQEKEEEHVKSEKKVAQWFKPNFEQAKKGISVIIQCRKTVKKISWHRKADYFVTVSPDSGHTSVLIHQLSKHMSQSPFKKSKGIIMDCKFHPFKPQLFVASQRYIKIYDLSQQTMIKKLMPGARWLSTIDIHPRGDNLLASSYDKRVLWHDLDLAQTPYKTLRYHDKAVRSIKFHKGGLPLFSSASDDGSIHVFHGTVYDDLMSNPLLVPLKKLTGHKVIDSLGVLDVVWHPKEAWLFSAGADGTARLWTT